MRHCTDCYINFIDLYEPYYYEQYIMKHIIACYNNIIASLYEKWVMTNAALRVKGPSGGLQSNLLPKAKPVLKLDYVSQGLVLLEFENHQR